MGISNKHLLTEHIWICPPRTSIYGTDLASVPPVVAEICTEVVKRLYNTAIFVATYIAKNKKRWINIGKVESLQGQRYGASFGKHAQSKSRTHF